MTGIGMTTSYAFNDTSPGEPTVTSVYSGTWEPAQTGTSDGRGLDPSAAEVPPVWRMVVIAIFCGLLIVGTILGNVLVCSAVVIVRKLRTPSNLLIASLAVSDLLVAGLVMPLAAVYEAERRWTMGRIVCDVWTSLDVMLCTASILNLCAISIDRYLVITRPLQYAMKRNRVHMSLMIAAVWSLSAVISIPPLFGWRENNKSNECALSQAMGYQIYATIGAFYLPMTVMIVIYYRIFMVSSRIAKSEVHSRPSSVRQRESSAPAATLPRCTSTVDQDPDEGPNDEGEGSPAPPEGSNATPPTTENGTGGHAASNGGSGGEDPAAIKMLSLRRPRTRSAIRRFTRTRQSFKSSMRERKATRTLGVIMGAFTACWLPFFIVALIKPFRPNVPQELSSLFLWLGYTNSFLNPIIYARFNRDFRGPFKDILLCRCAGINMRQRCESYVEQYGTGSIRDSSRPLTTTTV